MDVLIYEQRHGRSGVRFKLAIYSVLIFRAFTAPGEQRPERERRRRRGVQSLAIRPYYVHIPQIHTCRVRGWSPGRQIVGTP